MKIRNRLTITYALTAFLTLAAGGVFIYWFSARFHHQEFFRRLEERVDVTEQIFLEKNETVTQAVREKFLHTLDEEIEYVLTLQKSGLDSLDGIFKQGLGQEIQQGKAVFFWQQERQGVCKRYKLSGGDYVVVVTAVDIFGQSKLDNLHKILIVGTFLGSLVLISVGYWAAGRALRPLETKILKASQISAQKLDLRLEVDNPDDEIGQLAIAFNSTLDRLQAAFEAQRRFISNASHELRNPMTAIIGETEVLLAKERSPKEYRAALQIIQTEAERLEQLTNDLLGLASSDSMGKLPSPELLALDGLLLEVLDKFPAERQLLKIPDFDSVPMILASRSLLASALRNLVENAFKFSGNQPVTVEMAQVPNGCIIKVSDTGIGIPAAELGNIYQPLYRARNARRFRGTGFGLPLAKKVIEIHGGNLEVQSEEDSGTTATVFLPLAASTNTSGLPKSTV
ncbi:MAG: HAMP domain-containing histidine kinase [Saprospiraceae bacterium]|nr:HAMP domain-containing histidine kinase [Saprospiraceae bacterium]